MTVKVKPFLGRIVVEIQVIDTNAHLKEKIGAESGVSKDFLNHFELVLGENRLTADGATEFEMVQAKKVINRGKIIDMAPDCFGEEFQKRFGNDRDYPKLGDIVIFMPHKSYQVDAENKYHIIDDCDIVGYISKEDLVNE